jgi:acyl transferase domain-containing protein
MTSLNTNLEYKQLMVNALREIQSLRSQVKQLEAACPNEPIAIIGIGCRFPGDADSPAAFWQNLCEGIDSIDIVPTDRWDSQAHGSKMTTQYGGFIGHLQDFDAAFFGISPKEAASLDPQQRLLLETTWEALEQAGIIPESLAETQTGVFIGISSNDYSSHLLKRSPQSTDAYLATGNSHSTAAGRIAFTLGLQGPAIAVDTACSSSLVAVHLACQSLRQGESKLAIVGGVNRIFAPEFSINFSEARMLAPDGRCKTFDRHADGFARGEGGGVVILKRLADVTEDDRVYAVIRGSAVNQDGRSSGLTVPNGPAQRRVIETALKQANVTPEQINYIEAHGTGTALGDPIELGALQQVFGHRSEPLPIGSAKTNLGHLEAAAGIAGLIKTALVLYHRQIPPHLHCPHPTDKFDWANSPLTVVQQSLQIAPVAKAGVSSFGFSGTNAHIVLESSDRISKTLPQIISHPFDRQRHWIDSADSRELAVNLGHPLLGHALAVCDPKQFFAQVLRLNQPQYLADHVIFDRPILPAAGYIELALAAVIQSTGQESIQLKNIELHRPVEITRHATTIEVILDRPTWEIHSKTLEQDSRRDRS